MHVTNLSDVAAIIAIISFVGGITMYLFKKIVIEPLQKSIDALNKTIDRFKDTADKRMELIEGRVDFLEDQASRQDEKNITIFNTLKELKGSEQHVNAH